MKSVLQVGFAGIFHFAEKEYGIGWNEANDIFFGNAFKYGNVTDFYANDWDQYISDTKDVYEKASDVPKEVVADMCEYDKSFVITAAYLESKGIKGEVQIDAR